MSKKLDHILEIRMDLVSNTDSCIFDNNSLRIVQFHQHNKLLCRTHRLLSGNIKHRYLYTYVLFIVIINFSCPLYIAQL